MYAQPLAASVEPSLYPPVPLPVRFNADLLATDLRNRSFVLAAASYAVLASKIKERGMLPEDVQYVRSALYLIAKEAKMQGEHDVVLHSQEYNRKLTDLLLGIGTTQSSDGESKNVYNLSGVLGRNADERVSKSMKRQLALLGEDYFRTVNPRDIARAHGILSSLNGQFHEGLVKIFFVDLEADPLKLEMLLEREH